MYQSNFKIWLIFKLKKKEKNKGVSIKNQMLKPFWAPHST